jgi:hypothetical protein
MSAGRTDADKRALLAEVMDPTKVQLYCAQHFYFGPSTKAEVKPAKGCQRCWFVFYFHDIASTPPDKRAARMAELDEVLHKVVEEVEKGKWDFEPYRHAEISMESN